MSEENQVITATDSEGQSSMMVCKSEGENRKVCMDVGGEGKRETELSKMASGEENMLENNTYNLMEQLTVESKSLWRIKNDYRRDSNMDMETNQLWDVIEKDKEELVARLTEKLRKRL